MRRTPSRGRRSPSPSPLVDRRDRLRRRPVDRAAGQQRLAQDPDLLGQQPGRQPRGRQEDPPARAGQVREADRHQGQARGRPLVRPAQPDPRRHHLRPGPRRAQHRQHLVGLAAGHRRAAARWTTQNFAAIGGKDRFVAVRARPHRRRRARHPAAVPLYSLAYAPLLQQEDVRRRRHRAAAGHLGRAGRRRQEAHQGRQVGAWRVEGANLSREHPPRVHLRPSSTAREFFDAAGKPTFDLRSAVAAVKQYVDLMAKDKIVNPGNAEYAAEPVASATSPTARRRCCCGRPPPPTLKAQGMSADDYGVAPVPVPGRHARRRQAGQQHGRRHQHGGLQEHQEPRRRH